MSKRVLVTGVAGFLGSHLQDQLLKEGYDVFGIDDLSGGYETNIQSATHFYKIDLADSEKAINTILNIKPEIVFHLAADATEGRSQFTPVNCTKRNTLAFINTLTGAIKAGMKKFILTSSMAVYGDQTPPFSETMRRKPVDIYGCNKAMMERMLEIMAKVHEFDYNIVRPHNVYGPRQNMADPYRNVVAIFINKLLKSEQFYIYGKGDQTRAFSYIDDFTPYILQLATRDDLSGQIYNLGPTEVTSINNLGKAICKAFNVVFNPVYVPDRPAEVKHAHCTVDKAAIDLNFKTTVPLEEGIKMMVEWAKKLGPQDLKYMDDLEIINDKVPETWLNKLI